MIFVTFICILYYINLVISIIFSSITESEIEPLQAQLAEIELEISEMVGNIFLMSHFLI